MLKWETFGKMIFEMITLQFSLLSYRLQGEINKETKIYLQENNKWQGKKKPNRLAIYVQRIFTVAIQWSLQKEVYDENKVK